MTNLRKVIDKLIDEKILIDANCLRFTFYEVMITNKVKNEQEDEFLTLSKIKLNNMGYTVYFKGEEFVYDNANRRVQSNELLIAIKE